MIYNLLVIIITIIAFLVTSILFGLEVPLYLAIGTIGLLAYIYSQDPLVRMLSGWLGRIGLLLFVISLVYYIKTGTILPENPFQFKFLLVGLKLSGEQTVHIIRIFKEMISK